jgi:thermitase
MSPAQRMSLLASTLAAFLLVFIVLQGATREVDTQTEGEEAAEQPTYPPPGDEQFARDQIIVSLEEEATQADLAALNRRTDAETEEDLPRSDVNVVDLPNGLPVGEAVQRYEASPDVEYAEPDFVLQPAQASPNDPYYSRLYGLENTGQTDGATDADVDAKEAWGTTAGSRTTVVAVIDGGIDVDHLDLKNNIWVNADEVPDNGVGDDRNGYVDDRNGYASLAQTAGQHETGRLSREALATHT